MKVLTINQTIDLITSYMDQSSPQKAPDYLYHELKKLRKLKIENTNGGLLPYPNSIELANRLREKPVKKLANYRSNIFKEYSSALQFRNNSLKIAQ